MIRACRDEARPWSGHMACVVRIESGESSTPGPRTCRVLRLAIQALARKLLSGGGAAGTMVRTLRADVRYRRDQQQLLPVARTRDVRLVGASSAARLRVRGEGEPLSDPHEEAEGSGGAAHAAVRQGARPRRASRSGPLSTAAGME